MKALPRYYTVPPALPLDSLRNALHAAELPAVIVHSVRDVFKVTPAKGVDSARVDAFIRGFVAGFGS